MKLEDIVRKGKSDEVRKAFNKIDVNALLADSKWMPLELAALEQNLEAVHVFLEMGARVNQPGCCSCTPLYWVTSESCKTEVMKALLDKGADVDGANGEGVPLVTAARRGCINQVRMLTRYNANVDKPDDGATALMEAAESGYIHVMKHLINKRASVNVQDNSGETAFMYAVRHGFLSVKHTDKKGNYLGDKIIHEKETMHFRVLIKAGADINAENNVGMTALRIARGIAWGGERNNRVVSFLEQIGAKG